MSDQITVTGLVATPPRHIVTASGLPITSFRLVSQQRRFDRSKQAWVDGDSNWFTVTAFRQLAINAAASLDKGQRVVVAGRLRIRDWESGEKSGVAVEIDAESLGHDLLWGTSTYLRTPTASQSDDPSPEPAEAADHGFAETAESRSALGSEAAASETADLPF